MQTDPITTDASTSIEVEYYKNECERLQKAIQGVIHEVDSLFFDTPDEKGNYFHLTICNGGRNYPIGTPGKLCNCKNTAVFKRIRKQAVETDFYMEMLGQEGLEIAHRVSKYKLFGAGEKQPGQPYTNFERLNQEYNDLLAVVEVLNGRNIMLSRDQQLIDKKKKKMVAMYDYATNDDKEAVHLKHCLATSCTFADTENCSANKV